MAMFYEKEIFIFRDEDSFMKHSVVKMNYFPISLQIFKSLKRTKTAEPTGTASGPSQYNTDSPSAFHIEETDAESKLSVSRPDGNLFDPAEQISLSDVPSDQRKQNSFYRWFKRKLWCIKRSKSADSNRVKNTTFRNAKIEIKKPSSESKPKPEAKKQAINAEPKALQRPVSIKNRTVQTPNADPETPSTPQVTLAPGKERQVTFSDTVKTHIKTKYVTAEELQQIRGMSMNNRRILYQYTQNAESKGGIQQNHDIVITNRTSNIRRVKQAI